MLKQVLAKCKVLAPLLAAELTDHFNSGGSQRRFG
jgi:hypothetical protein